MFPTLSVRRSPAASAGTRLVAIVVPLSAEPRFTADEEISLRHLTHYLGTYDRYFIAPRGTTVERDGFRTLHVPRKFFGSAVAHNHLLLWAGFYRLFRDYEYILIHHLDSLAFSDDLACWCDAGWDYIGAPWIPCADTPWVREARVGNGGFTLMRVRRAIDVLHRRHVEAPMTFWADLITRNHERLKLLLALLTWANRAFPRWVTLDRVVDHWRVTRAPSYHGANNDAFWSYEAARYLPGFRVAPVEDGLRFAFEAAPRRCFEMNQRRMPFGCHAWTKFDREFWTPYLLRTPADAAAGQVSAVAATTE